MHDNPVEGGAIAFFIGDDGAVYVVVPNNLDVMLPENLIADPPIYGYMYTKTCVFGDSHAQVFKSVPGCEVLSNMAWCVHNIINPDKRAVIIDSAMKVKQAGGRLILVFGRSIAGSIFTIRVRSRMFQRAAS